MENTKTTLKIGNNTYSSFINVKLIKAATNKAVFRYVGNSCYNAKKVNSKIIVR